MKKIHLKGCLTLGLAALTLGATAQIQPPAFPATSGDNWYKDYVGVQFVVSEPAVIAGPMVYTITNDGSGAQGEWGGAITSPIFNKELMMAPGDSLGCQAIAAGTMTGKIALIWRGDCEFGHKALNAENAGADAVVIVNHTAGGPVGMGAGAQGANVTIPVIMISKEDGQRIWDRLVGQSETVKVSFKTWGFGHTSDLGILHGGMGIWHSFAVPHHQLASSNGNPLAYKGYDGAFVANFGSAPQVNVTLRSELTFTPTGQTSTLVREDSVSIPVFPPQDSVYAIAIDNPYDLHPGGTGRYDLTYSVQSSVPDQFTGDNSATYSVHVTDNLFSKSRFDFERNQPIATIYTRYAGTPNGEPSALYGNLYYNAVGGYHATSSQFSISKGADFPTLENTIVNGFIFKWNDANGDSIVVLGEMELVGQGQKAFSAADSGGHFFEMEWEDPITQQVVPLEADTWYWVAMDVPMDAFVGFDGVASYYPRSFIRHHASTPYNEFPSVAINFDAGTMQTASNLVPQHFLFDGGAITAHGILASDTGVRFSQQKNGYIPAISLRTSLWPTSVSNVTETAFKVDLYPNPAKDVVNIALNLDQTPSSVGVTLLDMTGKRLGTHQFAGTMNGSVQVPVQHLPNGVYLMFVDIDGKRLTRQFSITK